MPTVRNLFHTDDKLDFVATLRQLKAQLKLDHNLDDELLDGKLQAATGYVMSFLGVDAIEHPLPAAIVAVFLSIA